MSTLSSHMGGPSTAHAACPSAVSDESVEMSIATGASGSSSMKQQRGHSSSSPDGYLQPPQTMSHHHPTRRNTTGSQERAKAQKDAEEALTRTASKRRGSFGKEDDNRVLVGNLIGEDHVNYVLMYNMLTGIRIAVSRCQAKIKRPLTDKDFTARHKYSFDIIGNEVRPSAKYDFKFKYYAPWVFRELREDYFQLDPADYLLSLTAKYILSELGSPGKSGSFFYFSRDYRFIIKTIRHSEHKFLLSILKEYHAHVKTNPHTLLGRKIHFVIMNNLFLPHKDIHETYDLKGSTVGREYPEEKAQKNPRAVLKDLNWINREKMLELGPEKRALLTEQLRRDSELLKRVHVMDYSLLVGIHHVQRGNRDNVRSNGHLPEDTGDRQHFIFYQDDGGLQATNEANDSTDTIYYLGVIDYSDTHKISPVPPSEYADRFFSFMKAIMQGGDGEKGDNITTTPVNTSRLSGL
ncbi:hypothetical protein BU15DRAFT_90638 [Melanogaster broomeanus]|nr:hypothetical protein BU15DRAFT_90638 [Melanogaster broomeanus]